MSTKCPICLDSIRSDQVSTPCGHIFHGTCLHSWASRRNGGGGGTSRNPKFNCPSCKEMQTLNRVIKLYPAAGSSSPIRPSSPAIIDINDDDDIEESAENPEEKMDRLTNHLVQAVEGQIETEADACKITEQLQRLESIICSLQSTEPSPKASMLRMLKISKLIIRIHLLPTLRKTDALKTIATELSDEMEDMFRQLEDKNEEMETNRSTFKAQIAALTSSNDRKIKAQEEKVKIASTEERRVKTMYDALQQENRGLKAELEEQRETSRKASEKHDEETTELRNILMRQRSALQRKEQEYGEQIAVLHQKLLDLSKHTVPTPPPRIEETRPPPVVEIQNEPLEVDSKDMQWKLLDRKRPSLFQNQNRSHERPLKASRTVTQLGPLHLRNGKPEGIVGLGPRRRVLN